MRGPAPRLIFFAAAMFYELMLLAQSPRNRPGPGSELIRQGVQLDLDARGAEAREIFQKAIDGAPTPSAKANAQRAMAMSWAFEGSCEKTAEYEHLVIGYWKSQEQDSPANAFYEEGEMADEAARVCLDTGDLNSAYELYKRGHETGVSEPGIPAGRKDLWDYRWQSAQARIAARRGNQAEAEKHVAAAATILDDMKQKDPELYEQQARFQPYLSGYVAFYAGDYKSALENFEKANQNDAFIQCLMGMTYERLGDKAKAIDAYRKAADARGHNPPAAFARPFSRKKLAEAQTST